MTINVDLKQEELAASKGGLAFEKCVEEAREIRILAKWFKKDAEGNVTTQDRTGTDGKGSLGCTTTLGWANLSKIILAIQKLNTDDQLRLKLWAGDAETQGKTGKFTIDPTVSFWLKCKDKNTIDWVSLMNLDSSSATSSSTATTQVY